jgi:hypothetical protein
MVMTNDKLFNKKDGEQALPSFSVTTDKSGSPEAAEVSAGLEPG